MQTRVQKWGNSLAVRIPGAFARELALHHNSPVDMTIEGQTLTITPLLYFTESLSTLLSDIDEKQLHKGEGLQEHLTGLNHD